MKNRSTIRYKIIVATLFLTGLFFVFVTPVISWANDFFKKPDDFENISVIINVDNTVDLSWDKSFDIDLAKVEVQINDQVIEIDENTLSFARSEIEYPLSLKLVVYDWFGNSRETLDVNLNEPEQDQVFTRVYNRAEDLNQVATNIFARALLLGVILFGVSIYIYKEFQGNYKSKVLNAYPSFTLVPLVMLSATIVESESTLVSQLIIGAVISIVFGFLSYFVLLTVNILNNSIHRDLPLAQAARASQFIFSLISVYLTLILFFSSNYEFPIKLATIGVFVFALTFLTILLLPTDTKKTALFKTATITLVVLFATFVFGIWPIDYVYAILGIAVVYYMLLSVSLEIRGQINKYVWSEYALLVSLISLLLLLNSFWGINGPLI